MKCILDEIKAFIASAPKHLEELDGLEDPIKPYDRVVGYYRDVPEEVRRTHAAWRQIRDDVRVAEVDHFGSGLHMAHGESCRAFHVEIGWMRFKMYILLKTFFAGIADHLGLSPMEPICVRKDGEIAIVSHEAMAGVRGVHRCDAFDKSAGKC